MQVSAVSSDIENRCKPMNSTRRMSHLELAKDIDNGSNNHCKDHCAEVVNVNATGTHTECRNTTCSDVEIGLNSDLSAHFCGSESSPTTGLSTLDIKTLKINPCTSSTRYNWTKNSNNSDENNIEAAVATTDRCDYYFFLYDHPTTLRPTFNN